jgi:tetratricopeptide (TPR) repeat protein
VADLSGARASYEKALPLYREIADRLGEANVLQALGDLQRRVADLSGARASYEKALPLYREIADRLGEANLRQSLGNLALAESQPEQAFAHYQEALAIQTEIGDQLGVGACLGYLARAAAVGGNFPQAILLFDDSIKLFRTITDKFGEALSLHGQGEALLQIAQLQAAGLAALWQAKELWSAMHDPNAASLEAAFAQFAEQAADDEGLRALLDALPTQAEAIRQAAVAAIKAAMEAQAKESPNE